MAISFCRPHTRDSMAPRLSQRTFTKVKQIAILHVDLVNQCLELAVMQAAGEDGIDDLHHNTHDVNEVGGLGAQSLFVNDAMCILIVYGLGVSGGRITVAHQQRSCALLPNHHWGTVGRHACRQDGRNPGSIPPHSTFGHTSIINVRSPPSS